MASMIRMLAWCGTKHVEFVDGDPGPSRAASATLAIA